MPDWLQIILNLIETLAIVVGAVVAIKGINAWREEMIGRREAELSEEVLASFYQMQDFFSFVRFPGTFHGEGETRPFVDGETESQEKVGKGYYAPIERLQGELERYSHLHALKYRFMAYLGEEARKPFEELNEIKSKIISAAHILSRNSMMDDAEKYEKILGYVDEKDDSIKKDIDRIITDVEKLCKPCLSKRGK